MIKSSATITKVSLVASGESMEHKYGSFTCNMFPLRKRFLKATCP